MVLLVALDEVVSACMEVFFAYWFVTLLSGVAPASRSQVSPSRLVSRGVTTANVSASSMWVPVMRVFQRVVLQVQDRNVGD